MKLGSKREEERKRMRRGSWASTPEGADGSPPTSVNICNNEIIRITTINFFFFVFFIFFFLTFSFFFFCFFLKKKNIHGEQH